MNSVNPKSSSRRNGASGAGKRKRSNGETRVATPATASEDTLLDAEIEDVGFGTPLPLQEQGAAMDDGEWTIAGAVRCFDDGDWRAMPRVPVILWNDDDHPIAQTVTDNDGDYAFPGLDTAGIYTIHIPTAWLHNGTNWLLQSEDAQVVTVYGEIEQAPVSLFLPAFEYEVQMVRARVELEKLIAAVVQSFGDEEPESGFDQLTTAMSEGLTEIASSIDSGFEAITPTPPEPADPVAAKDAIKEAQAFWADARPILKVITATLTQAPDFSKEIDKLDHRIEVQEKWLANQLQVLEERPAEADAIRAAVEQRKDDLTQAVVLMLEGLANQAKAKTIPVTPGGPRVDWILVQETLEKSIGDLSGKPGTYWKVLRALT